jgi:hypothetical protein
MNTTLKIEFVDHSFNPPIGPNLVMRARQFSEAARAAIADTKPLEVYANGIPANMPKHRDVGVPANPFAGNNSIHRCRTSDCARNGYRY